MPFFEAHVEWSICKLQETPKISYLSIEINYDLDESKENDDTRAPVMECDPTDWGLDYAILIPEQGPKQ